MNKITGAVRSALINWLGIPAKLTDESFVNALIGQEKAGQMVTEQSVLSLSAAWACTRLIAETISTLPLKIYERRDDGRRLASEHTLYNILHHSPNATSTPATFWESMTASILLRGNAFAEKQMVGSRLVGLRFLNPNRLQIEIDADGRIRFFERQARGARTQIPAGRIFHIPGFSLDGQWGVSAIQYGAAIFGSALAASEAANATFEHGLAPTVAFTLDRVVKAEHRTAFRESIRQISGAINAGKSPVLEAGMDAKVIGIPPKDAQLLESRAYGVEEVCRWFRVDPSMVGHGNKDSNWGTGLEQKLIGFLTFTLRPWLSRIEQSINKHLLSSVDQQRFYAEFSIEGLLRADSKARADFFSTMVNNGIFTRDEVRRLENMPLMGGNAEVLTVQSAMAPLDALNRFNEE